ncbi:universal stress protein [Streptomyces kebangsaanensis]|uniref:universal stress protein n=1 Tax=Streptomyces kebangsaanensis TaxID=864058 RepID=UPI00093A9B0B|nr:universal stress protein [Streptomyces kebangsaanensis]
MPRTVTVGIDGSSESRAAAEWAAREARLLGLPLRLVHAWQPLEQAPLLCAETDRDAAEQMLRDAAEGLRLRHPGIEVTVEHLPGRPAEVLCRAAEEAGLLVLGSRALGGVGGFVLGSVGLSVVAHAERPVVLVRAGERAADEPEAEPARAHRPVVLGLDTAAPDDGPIRFAFEAAARRNTSLRAVHGRRAPAAGNESAALSEVLRPWRQEYPDVGVVEDARFGDAAQLLVDASREASLVVVGRRVRPRPFGTRIGPVAHNVLHHATAPVAVVAHD